MMMGTLATTAGAQCKVAANSHEGRLLVFYAVPLALTAATVSPELVPGAVRLGFEAGPVPKPRRELQQTGECFFAKSENTSLSPVFARPRISVGLPGSLLLEASYLPPLKIADARANLGSVAISHSRNLSRLVRPTAVFITVRANATVGTVQGPITCPRRALQTTNPAAPCYGTKPSNDKFEPRMYGGDAIVALQPSGSHLTLYGGIGAQKIYPTFEVGFTDGSGKVDRTRVELLRSPTRMSLTTGVSVPFRSIFDFGAQLYSVPQDVTTLRVSGGMRLR